MKKNNKVLREESIMIENQQNFRVIEAYNRLRNNILYFSLDGNNRVIQVESSVAGEGKTTLASNLAVSFAQANKKVVIIDLDFRKSRTHRPFKIINKDGLSDYLIDAISFEQLIKKTEYNVDVINTGTHIENTASIFLSDKFKNLINKLRNSYDYVILDCPPVLEVSDYISIGSVADCCLFVVAYGITKKNQVRDAISELKKNNINLIGSVYTFYDVKKDQHSYNKHYNDYYEISE